MSPWYERYFTADYWVYAGAEYTAERTAAELDYLAAVLADAPGRRVLDIGCGLGRHAIGLARRGFDVTGVDVSQWALSRAAEAAEAAGVPVRFERLDALASWPAAPTAPTAPAPLGQVDAVVCVQAFGWGTDADQLRMLRSMLAVLAPGGLLVLDHSNVSAIMRMYSPRTVVDVEGHTFEFLRSYDQLTGRSGGVLRVRRPDGRTVESPDDVRLYQPPEVGNLLRAAGFEVLRADADFRIGASVGIDTRYVQFVARAPARLESALSGHRGRLDAGVLDLRWAPDEADFGAEAVAKAWAGVSAELVDRARRYDLTDPYGANRCTAVLAEHFGVALEASQVTAGAGATGLLRALATLAAGGIAGGTVLAAPAGHPELPLAAREVGAVVRHADLSTPASAVAAAIELRPALIVLDRPGVDGRVWPIDDVHALARAAAELGAVLVVDETCAAYLPPSDSAVGTVAKEAANEAGNEAGNVVVVRSMSKGYCCGGLRVGFAVCSPELAGRVRAVCPPLAVAALSVDVALELLRQGDVLAGLREHVVARKPRFVELLTAAGCDVHPGDPRLPWVTVGPAPPLPGIAGKPVPGSSLTRLSVPLSADRWTAAQAALGGT